jgi:hypothetical protein
MKKYSIKLLAVLFFSFVLIGCEGLGMYVIGVASTTSADYVTDKYILPQSEVGTIFQLKDGRWMTNKGIILKDDDPRIPHLELHLKEALDD